MIYLYPSVADADAGEQAGGTGFLFGLESEASKGSRHLYAVTNSHVIREGNSTVVRLNTKKGETDVLATDFNDWFEHPDQHDLAVCPLSLDQDYYEYDWIGADWLLWPETIIENNIGPGDDVYMVGRFVSHEGKQENRPAVRFGNIAVMPWEPVKHPLDRIGQQESYVIEARSVSGFSGSPVFVFIPMFSQRYTSGQADQGWAHEGGPWLLGIDWGHIPIFEPVIDEGGKEHPGGWKVKSNAGMVGVVPAWRLAELLFKPEVMMEREKRDRELKQGRKRHPPAELDMKAKPFGREDFEGALKRVSRRVKPSPPEQASSGT